MDKSPAQTYQDDLVPMLFAPWAGDLLDAAGVAAGDAVLDVACGTGVVARAVAERVGTAGSVVAIDFAEPMVDVARSMPEPGGTSIRFEVADAADLPVADGSFDAVVCQQGFQFFPDKQAAAREMHRALRPGGRLAVSVWAGLD